MEFPSLLLFFARDYYEESKEHFGTAQTDVICAYVDEVTDVAHEAGLRPREPLPAWWAYAFLHHFIKLDARVMERSGRSLLEDGSFVPPVIALWDKPQVFTIDWVMEAETRKSEAQKRVLRLFNEQWIEGERKLAGRGLQRRETGAEDRHIRWLYLHIAESMSYEVIAEDEGLDDPTTVGKAVRRLGKSLELAMPGPGRKARK